MRTADAYAYKLDVSPGNGTRYRLIVVIGSPGTIDLVAWPDLRWSAGDFGHKPPSAEWLAGPGRLPSKADAEMIAAIVADLVDEVVEPVKAPRLDLRPGARIPGLGLGTLICDHKGVPGRIGHEPGNEYDCAECCPGGCNVHGDKPGPLAVEVPR